MEKQREIKRKLNREIADFLKIQNHYFPNLTYEIEVILYVMLLKNICSVESMQEMVAEFNEDECIKNIYKIFGLKEKQYIPHYVTINECLSKLDRQELEKIRKGMVYNLIRKKKL